MNKAKIEQIEDKPKHFKPTIKLGSDRLLTVRDFVIARNERSTYQYMVTLNLPHDGEINVMKLETDNSVLLSFQFEKHEEIYRGSWVNYAEKWMEGEEVRLVLFFVGVRTK